MWTVVPGPPPGALRCTGFAAPSLRTARVGRGPAASARAPAGTHSPHLFAHPRRAYIATLSTPLPETRTEHGAAVDSNRILIIDYGSQFTQLIARRIRE